MLFCHALRSEKRYLPHRKLGEDFTFTLFEKANVVDEKSWTEIAGKQNLFFNLEFLHLVERGQHARLQCRYAIVYRNQKPCGILYFQITDFNAGVFGDLLNGEVNGISSAKRNLFTRYINANRNETLMRLFTCGNNLISGDYGMKKNSTVDEITFNTLALKIVDAMSREEKLRGTISAVLLKDYDTPLVPEDIFNKEKYQRFIIEPNMVIEIPDGVRTLAEYAALFSKKYRNRTKKILEHGKKLNQEYFDLNQIKKHEKEIYSLYENIFDKAKFKLIKLPENYFSEMKRIFGDKFILKVSFFEERIVSFFTCMIMPENILEAHYVGMDYNLNPEFELYQNILYSLIEETIILNFKKINLGRTAAEIKSTVGARPENLYCYLKAQNMISSMMQKPFIQFLQPGQWIQRNPFREEQLAGK